ncbi:leucine-rich repeats and immunoglobulin-like domains protein 2 isoform X1 [Tribolium castaneum]|uniref:leucine-rich repeats and immunoglobulin-like domains protein 2 isoform X1 n=1 Tax=Tribolium castaneum TaxID=7070 RepID=UPI00046C1C4C|nr:PREDICTED: leucine-rich repeats and immunoglobulin-like domains protein 2 isoform X1 [Tribolium castaneum]|eukprot:XP_008200245.1 PREDICTED: leucine-rich repeats and immunoglobulin-like domains protein 2 isoform X1 [Tribolium castaneum]
MVGVCYLATIIIYIISSASCTKSKDCPEICTCLGSYVDCSSKRLQVIPSNLPKWTTHLDLRNNTIKKLNDVTWRNLTILTELILNKNEISVIPNDAFSNQKQLKILELNRNQLKSIEALTFKSLERLYVLKLKRNQITQLKDGAFYGLLSIDKLILDYNHILVISKGWLYGLQSLKELSLNHNYINFVEPEAWEFCKKLALLDLSNNRLESVAANTFKHLNDLQKLVLSNNKITFIEERAFSHLPNLKYLHLNNNKISWTIEDANGVFQGLGNLIKFYLADNNIKSISKNAFIGLKNVTYLNLNDNNITSIQMNAFSEVPLLSDLVINTTYLLCDCNIRWFYEWLDTKQFKIRAICAYPEWLRGQSLVEIPTSNFTCDELPKPRLTEEPEPEIMALKGENITLSCTAMSSSNSPMTFQWKKDNVDIINMNINENSSSDGKTTEAVSKLNIYRVQHSNAGKYQCVVSNIFGTTYSQKSSISVLIFPTFLKRPDNVTVKAGDVAKLVCAAHGEPQPEIAWQKDGGNDFPAARERRMHVLPADDSFFISNVKPTDMGIYSCTAHNAAGTIVTNASLTVYEKPSFVKSMENKEVTAGELVVLQCMASGTPKPTITWYKNGEPIRATERHFFTAEEQLMIIVDTVQSDSGKYECHLNNSLGEKTGYSLLRVKPGFVIGNFTTTDMMGIIIITVVCCAVATSIIWVVIIYQTRRRMPPPAAPPLEGPLELDRGVQFTDNASDRSSCRDSGTGDSARRSNDDLAHEDYKLIINEEPQPGWNVMRIASLTYIPADPNSSHAPLLPGTPYVRSTNHDRPETPDKGAPPAEQSETTD